MNDRRVCKKCKIEKPLAQFVAHARCKFGRTHTCKDCESRIEKARREKNKESFVQPLGEKKCAFCELVFPVSQFTVNRDTASGLGPYCKSCNNAKKREYAKRHPDKISQRDKRYRERHPEREKFRHKKYRKENKEKINEAKRLYRQRKPEIISMSNQRCKMRLRGIDPDQYPKELLEAQVMLNQLEREVRNHEHQ